MVEEHRGQELNKSVRERGLLNKEETLANNTTANQKTLRQTQKHKTKQQTSKKQ